ncbi:peptide/nickel transport system permease protein [Arthrobacter sp. V4I6]|uniref:ABC transporter permease n=1 Tax=unclassified Arthrobacter TaxID=235627 RepID=UPI002781FE9B|nr:MULTISPECIES: ABC transporter permease [unclassified Arthrobacter]MDQ0819900.1 peptide/nickel transport system permease protein [Arthrobacter sp. V1I7]MDQ0854081.1 peptide/nickel transport system permease protein [Arthrobacter sp. V4I6]
MRKLPPTILAAGSILVLIVTSVALSAWLAPYPPADQDLAARLAAPSAAHWLGTDNLGRDTLSRLLDGGQFSLTIAALATVLTAVTGTAVGVLSARRRGWLDEFFTRTNDVLLAMPEMVVALFLVAAMGTGYHSLLLALTVTGWTPFARLARSLAYDVSARGFIEAAHVVGCPPSFIVLRHILPHLAGPLLGQATLRFGQFLINVGALSYLGLGVQPPQSDWGSMLATAQPYAVRAPMTILVPGLVIFVVALCVTLIGQYVSRMTGSRLLLASAPVRVAADV